MRKKAPPRLKVTPPRAGYDSPLLLYLPEGTRAAIRAKYGERGEAPAIRALILADLGTLEDVHEAAA